MCEVASDGSAEDASPLIAAKSRLAGIQLLFEIRLAVERFIPKKPESCPVERVRSGLRDCVDQTITREPKFRFIRVGDNGEFLNGLLRVLLQEAADDIIVIVATIDSGVHASTGTGADTDRTNVILRWIDLNGGANARRQHSELLKSAPVDRKRFNLDP